MAAERSDGVREAEYATVSGRSVIGRACGRTASLSISFRYIPLSCTLRDTRRRTRLITFGVRALRQVRIQGAHKNSEDLLLAYYGIRPISVEFVWILLLHRWRSADYCS